MTYDRTVKAALAETKSKFALAEALALDVPPRRRGGSAENDQSVIEYITGARAAIIDAGGESRAVETLSRYRMTALWVESSGTSDRTFRWITGVSFSAHREACNVGMTYDEFAGMSEKTERAIRAMVGRASKDLQPEKIVGSWSPEQKAAAARELLAEPEVAEQVSDAITDYVAADHKRTADVISKRRDAQPAPQPDEPTRTQRDYDYLTEQHVNGLSVVLAAESSGKWSPDKRSEALLYFLTQILGDRSAPTGEQADLVNKKLDDLFTEAEAYANSEAS